MKRVIIILLLFTVCAFSQAIYNPKVYYPFDASRDTILSAANLTSGAMNIGKWRGSVLLGVQTDTMSGGGTVAKAIDVYCKIKINGLGYGVPYDSVAVDSILIGQIDSTHANDEETVYFDLSNETWWTWADYIQFIFDPAASADSIMVNAVLKGQ